VPKSPHSGAISRAFRLLLRHGDSQISELSRIPPVSLCFQIGDLHLSAELEV
jgi:hypothetical protein